MPPTSSRPRRRLRGLERMEQIKYAVLERDGKITIVPEAGARS